MKKGRKMKTSLGLEENVEGALCYVLGWITGLIFLLLENKSNFVKFHALQSVVTFLGLTVAAIVFSLIPVVGWVISTLVSVLTFVLWIVLIIKSYRGEKYKLPIAGDIAEQHSK